MTLKNPLDMHLHLRDKAMLRAVTPHSARDFKAAVIMPNLVPPITTKTALLAYKRRILNACNALGDENFDKRSENLAKNSQKNEILQNKTKNSQNLSPKNEKTKTANPQNFTPLMTLFYQNYDVKFLESVRDEIFAIKLYPAGITTNSQGGVSNLSLDTLAPTLQAMSELKIPLLIHGETNGFVLDREAEFAPFYAKIARNFPRLRIVMEHITTKALCELLFRHENLYATITLHHLLLTLDDVVGGKMRPHLFCKPIAKTPSDRKALRELALSGFEKVMFGSDSAPHPKSDKECCGCAAGVFSAPVILPLLAELFDEYSKQQNLQRFISDNALKIHGLKLVGADKIITLKRQEWQVPRFYGKVVPFMAGKILKYNVV